MNLQFIEKELGRKPPELIPVANRQNISPEISSPVIEVGQKGDSTGLLMVRIEEGEKFCLPPHLKLSDLIPQSIRQPIYSAGGISGAHSNPAKSKFHLPYCIVECDRNETLVDAVDGDFIHPKWKTRVHFDIAQASEVTISIFLRVTAVRQKPEKEPMSGDIFLGSVKVMPKFSEQIVEDNVFQLNTPFACETKPVIRIQTCFKINGDKVSPLSIASFELLKVIGKGSFGKVMQVRKKDTDRIYAMKIIKKSHIVSRDEVSHTLAERLVLAKLKNPFIVPLRFCFQSDQKLYFVLSFVNGGELFFHLQREGKFPEARARFYAAELLSALDCLHKHKVIYRDLKPENILLDYCGHIALCDFGLCKIDMKDKEKTNTFCGTPEYLAPEVFVGEGYTKAVDWWTFGILIYEMITGLPPFYDENIETMYQKILNDPLVFPADMSTIAKSLLSQLIERDPNRRMGNNGAEEIRKHPFFASINFDLLEQKKIQPPFKPMVESEKDTSNFDETFTSETPMDSVIQDSNLSSTVQQQFVGFTYNAESGLAASVRKY